MDKEKKKKLRRKLGAMALRLSSFIFKHLPLGATLGLGRGIGAAGYFFSPRLRNRTVESLQVAFGGKKTEAQIKAVAVESCKLISEASCELLYFLHHRREIKERVDIVGKENLEQALKRGKGVVAVTAHLGNFPLIFMRLKEAGFKVSAMARPMRDKQAEDFIRKLTQDTGVETILSYPRKQAVFNSLRALGNNGVLVLHMDQNFGTGGVWVKFFGKLAATPVGPLIMALRAEAAVVPIFIIRKQRGRHTIFIEKEVPLDRSENKDETILLNAIKVTKVIEAWVDKYPEFWSWIHRRWKSRPNQNDLSIKYKVQAD